MVVDPRRCQHVQAGAPLTHLIRLSVERTAAPAEIMPHGWIDEIECCQSCALSLHLEIVDKTTPGGLQW